MTAPSDFPGRARQISEQIAEDDFRTALKGLLDLASQFAERDRVDEATVFSMNFRQIEAAERRRACDFATSIKHRTDLAFAMLGLLHTIEDDLQREYASA